MRRSATLAEVCEINPRLPKAHGLRDDTQVSFVPMAAVSEVSGSIESWLTRPFAGVRRGYTTFANDDVLFAKITPCMENGKAAIARGLHGGRGFGSTEFHVLRAGPDVLPEWLFYFVRREPFRHEAKRNFTGTAGQQRVPTTFLAQAPIPIPPLGEQRRIVDLLTRAEGIVRLRREAQRKAAELIPAIFIDMFGDPAANPNGWPTPPLGGLLCAPIRNGISPSRAGRHTGHVLTLSAITRGRFDPSAVKESMFAAPLAEHDAVSTNDFLICRGNGNPGLVGAGCFPTRDMPAVAFPDTAIAVRPDRSRLNPAYLSAYWKTSHARNAINRIAKTTNGTFKVNQAGVLGLAIPLPPLDRQSAFAEYASRIESIDLQQGAALNMAQATFNALLAQAFAP